MSNHKKPKSACGGGSGGAMAERRNDVVASVSTLYQKSKHLSNLLDQAVAEAERCAALAEHYGRLAEKHGRIKAELERLIPLDEPVILEGVGALADYAEVLAEEVWGDD